MNPVQKEMEQAVETALRAMTMSIIVGVRDGNLANDESSKMIDILHVWASDAHELFNTFFAPTAEEFQDGIDNDPYVARIVRAAANAANPNARKRKRRPNDGGNA